MRLKEEESVDMDVWQNRVQQDIADLKNEQSRQAGEQTTMKDAIRDLQFSDKMQDKEISMLKETLAEIRGDTQWIRRKITGAIITSVSTAVIGGVIGVVIYRIF